LAFKFNDVLKLGGRYICLSKGLGYLEEDCQYLLPRTMIISISMTHGCTTKNIWTRKEAHNVTLELFGKSLKPCFRLDYSLHQVRWAISDLDHLIRVRDY
jgi:hypothetical protein